MKNTLNSATQTPTYSICISNYNMAKTLPLTLNSIIHQLPENSEVVVADDGSTDGSVDILEQYSKKYKNFRFISLPRDSKRKLGETFNIPIREAKGKYIIHKIDADDVYEDIIVDFVKIYHAFERKMGARFYFKGDGINMATREFLLEYGPYRNLYRMEDKDYWRRLIPNNSLIWLDHRRAWKRIGYDKSPLTIYKNKYHHFEGELMTGMRYTKYIRFNFRNWPVWQALVLSYVCSIVYLRNRKLKPLDLPEQMRDPQSLEDWKRKNVANLKTLILRHNIEFDYESLSNHGKSIFL